MVLACQFAPAPVFKLPVLTWSLALTRILCTRAAGLHADCYPHVLLQASHLVSGMHLGALHTIAAALPRIAGEAADPCLTGQELVTSNDMASIKCRWLGTPTAAGMFPISGADFEALDDAVERLTLNDASVVVQRENSAALGAGFRCG